MEKIPPVSQKRPDEVSRQYDEGSKAEDFARASLENAGEDIGRALMREEVKECDHDGELLDIGCGNGIELEADRKMGFTHLHGVDPSEEFIQQARVLVQGAVDLQLGSYTQMPSYSDGTFTTITARHSLHYVSQRDLDQAIRTVARLLAPGGKFIAIIPHPNADALSTPDLDGNISWTLFGKLGKKPVPIKYPLHKREEYFGPTFEEFFALHKEVSFNGPEQDRDTGKIPNSLLFVAIRK